MTPYQEMMQGLREVIARAAERESAEDVDAAFASAINEKMATRNRDQEARFASTYHGEPTASEFARTGPSNKIAPTTTLQEIAQRIHKAGRDAFEISLKLREHADSLHGPAPEPAMSNDARSESMGQIDGVFDALAFLDEALSAVAYQSGRNCNIA